MHRRATIVLDVGKTLSKVGLWDADGMLIERRMRPNGRIDAGRYLALDAPGIASFLRESLTELGGLAKIGAIIPVCHGAAAAIIDESGLVQPPLDYEHPMPSGLRGAYDTQRDAFELTGSPALPGGLNLGMQFHYLESLDPGILASGRTWLPWPQYWAWLLSGVAASELTSLGCHTDLWYPLANSPSSLATRRRWAPKQAPLHPAGAVLGPLKADWARKTGVPADCRIHCGLHDSNAALLAARGSAEDSRKEATVLSTGTWFVAMRTPARESRFDIRTLDPRRDCLLNVDAFGNVIPSARFMGGREIELLTGTDCNRIDIQPDQPALLEAIPAVLSAGAMVVPTRAPGSGPFPDRPGNWISMPARDNERRAAIALYAALVADAALDLIGARDQLLIEGRFAASEVFVRALASLRPQMTVLTSHTNTDASFGALRLINPSLPAPKAARVSPLPGDLRGYREQWQQQTVHLRDAMTPTATLIK